MGKSLVSCFFETQCMYEWNTLLMPGAGDGAVTRQMAQHFRNVYVTEVSSTMLWRLQEQGYK